MTRTRKAIVATGFTAGFVGAIVVLRNRGEGRPLRILFVREFERPGSIMQMHRADIVLSESRGVLKVTKDRGFNVTLDRPKRSEFLDVFNQAMKRRI